MGLGLLVSDPFDMQKPIPTHRQCLGARPPHSRLMDISTTAVRCIDHCVQDVVRLQPGGQMVDPLQGLSFRRNQHSTLLTHIHSEAPTLMRQASVPRHHVVDQGLNKGDVTRLRKHPVDRILPQAGGGYSDLRGIHQLLQSRGEDFVAFVQQPVMKLMPLGEARFFVAFGKQGLRHGCGGLAPFAMHNLGTRSHLIA